MRDKDIQILWLSGKSYQVGDHVHTHEHQFYQLQFFLSGSEILKLDDKKNILKTNYLTIIPPHTQHSYKFLQNSKVLDIKFKINKQLIKLIPPIIKFESIYINDPFQLSLLQQLLESGTSPITTENRLTLDTLLKLFLLKLNHNNIFFELPVNADNSLPQIEIDSKIYPILDFLKNNYSDSITLATLSERFHYSESYLTRIFRHQIQLTPNQVLQKIRLEKGIHLLDNSEYPIEYIANSVGLSFNYFSKFFKEQKGVSPTEYRNSKRVKFESVTLSEDFDLTMEP